MVLGIPHLLCGLISLPNFIWERQLVNQGLASSQCTMLRSLYASILFSGVALHSLPDEVRQLVAAAGVDELPTVNRAVVVGNRFAAGETHEKPDGTVVHTIWGEIAWQLAGRDGYALVAESDRNGTNPGDRIRDVLKLATPCMVLIDEWGRLCPRALRAGRAQGWQFRQPVWIRSGPHRGCARDGRGAFRRVDSCV